MEFQDVIRRRRMVRNFDSRPLPPELAERVVANALRAPSAGFTQGTEVLVLQGIDQTSRYWDTCFPAAGRSDFRWPGVLRAPLLLVFFASAEAYFDRYSEPDKGSIGGNRAVRDPSGWPAAYWDVDAAFASLLALLTAVDAGLGALFFAVSRPDDAAGRVRDSRPVHSGRHRRGRVPPAPRSVAVAGPRSPPAVRGRPPGRVVTVFAGATAGISTRWHRVRVEQIVERVGRAEWLDKVAQPLSQKVSETIPKGALKDALSGTWLGHPLHPDAHRPAHRLLDQRLRARPGRRPPQPQGVGHACRARPGHGPSHRRLRSGRLVRHDRRGATPGRGPRRRQHRRGGLLRPVPGLPPAGTPGQGRLPERPGGRSGHRRRLPRRAPGLEEGRQRQPPRLARGQGGLDRRGRRGGAVRTTARWSSRSATTRC